MIENKTSTSSLKEFQYWTLNKNLIPHMALQNFIFLI